MGQVLGEDVAAGTQESDEVGFDGGKAARRQGLRDEAVEVLDAARDALAVKEGEDGLGERAPGGVGMVQGRGIDAVWGRGIEAEVRGHGLEGVQGGNVR